MSIFKIIIICLIATGILFPIFIFSKDSINLPETLGEIKTIGEKTVIILLKTLPENIKKIWQEEILPIWQKMYYWLKKTFWDPFLGPFFQKEIEKRKPFVKEEFQKEKVEMKTEIKKGFPYFLEKIKLLFKK